jgi:hypothetical protein
MPLSINDNQHNNTFTLCRVSHFIYCYAEFRILIITMVSVTMLNFVMLSVYMLSVIMLSAIKLSAVKIWWTVYFNVCHWQE